ncbi:hypothetical protein BDZ94DRAFT_1259847 [Collybia nuda]|uniref:Uncharacterized protein n=1 Tax=Collybia nuda TaxID=64659 RepID=A0A9P5Y784_9AGAR|nr:hypothetical protein BDZ94DRAFT_1259847 [Collybia nuda]
MNINVFPQSTTPLGPVSKSFLPPPVPHQIKRSPSADPTPLPPMIATLRALPPPIGQPGGGT